jgi:hypothetical protein
VGPSIALGSQEEKGSWADLIAAARRIMIAIKIASE